MIPYSKHSTWVHFVGIGGAGMSAIAKLAIKRGYKVTGSDIKPSENIRYLEQMGAKISIGHTSENIKSKINQLVYSSCISKDNIELLKARKLNIPLFHRSEFLAQLMDNKFSIAVCGSHGKTTTSALIYHILYSAGFSTSAAIGGNSYNSYENIEQDTTYFIAEADESDGSFINLSPDYIVVTNLDKDHFDFYENWDNMLKYFNRFLAKIKNPGNIFLNQNIYKYKHKLLKHVTASVDSFRVLQGKKNRYSRGKFTNRISASNIKFYKDGVKFNLDYLPYFKNEEIQLALPGMHNLENALGAIGVCTKLGVGVKQIKNSLLSFKGVRRRFQVRLNNSKYTLIEDYAHHPTEIRATIDTVRKCYSFDRIVGIFQPHRYTRTELLAVELAKALHPIDVLILTDIYPANEPPIPGVNVENIYRYACNSGHKNAICLPMDDIKSYVTRKIRPNDLILVLGAGNIYEVAHELERKLEC